MKYGRRDLTFCLPGHWPVEVLSPPCSTPAGADWQIIEEALDNPLGSSRLEDIARPGEKAAIVVSDRTRQWQRPDLSAAAVLARLKRAGLPDRDIFIVIATGMHRPLEAFETRQLIGQEIYDRLAVYNHDCDDHDQLSYAGEDSNNGPVYLNRRVMEADRKIVIGGIAFHNLAGFSGGRKAVLPGVAGRQTIQANHALAFESEGELRPGVGKGLLKGNPVAEDMDHGARLLGVDFSVNVVVDADNRFVKATAGNVFTAQEKGCAVAGRAYLAPLQRKADLVLANVGGFPRDVELYQSMKALDHAIMAAEEGAVVVLSSFCTDGLGSRPWRDWLILGDRKAIARSLRKDFDFPGLIALKLMNFVRRFRIALFSGMEPGLVMSLGLHPVGSMEEAVAWAEEQRPRPGHVIFMPAAGATVPSGPIQ
jgi:lactate racemase